MFEHGKDAQYFLAMDQSPPKAIPFLLAGCTAIYPHLGHALHNDLAANSTMFMRPALSFCFALAPLDSGIIGASLGTIPCRR
jgi:hypothetical protein